MKRYLLDTHLIYWWMTADTCVGAQAAPFPKIAVTGVVGNSLYNVNGYTGTIDYDPSAILGKTFTLEMVTTTSLGFA